MIKPLFANNIERINKMYGNCLFIALINKIKYGNTMYLIKPKLNTKKYHIMWKDKDGRNYHFTRNKDYNVWCEWWFKGHIEELHMGTIEKCKGIRIKI